MARRRFRRSFAGKRGGRKFFWFRFAPFFIGLRQLSTATHSDLFLTESQWQDPTAEMNMAQKGGARMERFICEFGLSLLGRSTFWDQAGQANIAMIPEFMVWKQSDQFATTVIDSASFEATREDQRVIMDQVPGEVTWQNYENLTSDNSIRTVYGRYETKSKVRMADGALGVAWRGNYDEGSVTLEGYTDWFRPTILMSTP